MKKIFNKKQPKNDTYFFKLADKGIKSYHCIPDAQKSEQTQRGGWKTYLNKQWLKVSKFVENYITTDASTTSPNYNKYEENCKQIAQNQ